MKYFWGSLTDSPTCESPAKCITASNSWSLKVVRMLLGSRRSPSTKVAFLLISKRFPVDKLSKTTTSWPQLKSFLTAIDPMYPAPPVTNIFMR